MLRPHIEQGFESKHVSLLFRYESADTKGPGAPFVAQARQWFDSVWSQLSWKTSDLDLA